MYNGELDAVLAPAFYLLIGFALELLLKAVCMQGGVSSSEVKTLGHDLHKAYLRAMQAGMLPEFMTPLGNLALALRDQHKKNVFRYTPDVPQVVVPPPEHCIDVLDEAITKNLP